MGKSSLDVKFENVDLLSSVHPTRKSPHPTLHSKANVTFPARPLRQTFSNKHIIETLNTIRLTARTPNSDYRFPHPFPARMPLDVAKVAVQRLSLAADVVLDPMLGSGTTAVAAQLLGRHAIGFDSDPLAVLLATARCRPASSQRLTKAISRVASRAQETVARIDLDERKARLSSQDDILFLDRWFSVDAQSQLFALIELIRSESDGRLRNTLIALFSSMIITKQGGVTFGLDLSRSRAHFKASKRPTLPLVDWPRRARAFIRHAENAELAFPSAGLLIARGDARALPLADGSADLILTSPPYLDAVDYMRAHRFTLLWLGYSMFELREVRGRAIGSQRGLAEEELPGTLLTLFDDHVLLGGRRKPILRRFLKDILASLEESRRCLKPGGVALYAVGPSLFSRRRYDGGDTLASIASHAGWEVVGQTRRYIAAFGRSLPPPKRSDRSAAMNKRLNCEIYVALRNPE